MTHRTPPNLLACVLLLLVGVSAGAPAHADPSRTESLKELLLSWESLGKLSKSVMEDIHRWGPNGPYRGVINEQVAERFAIIETYQLQTQPGVESQLAAFEEKYGQTREAVETSFAPLLRMAPGERLPAELEDLAGRIHGSYPEPERLLRETRAELAGLQTTRVQTADYFVTQARPTLEHLEQETPERQQPALIRLEQELRFAVAFDPTNKEAAKLLKTVEDKLTASAALLEQWLDAQVFPSPEFEFSGPGTAADLTASSLAWFQGNAEWNQSNGEHPFHVILGGNWVVTRRNILGEPVQWGLPIYMALWKDAQPELARVFTLTMVTEIRFGVAQSPPWKGCLVGSSFPMRRSKVPGGDAAGAVSSSAEASAAPRSAGASASAASEDSGGVGVSFVTILACCCTTLIFLVAGFAVFFLANQKKAQAAAGASPQPGPPPAPPAL